MSGVANHEGLLKLLGFGLRGAGGFVRVQSDAGFCRMTLEEALRRLDQFSIRHQAVLLQLVADFFNLGQCERPTG